MPPPLSGNIAAKQYSISVPQLPCNTAPQDTLNKPLPHTCHRSYTLKEPLLQILHFWHSESMSFKIYLTISTKDEFNSFQTKFEKCIHGFCVSIFTELDH